MGRLLQQSCIRHYRFLVFIRPTLLLDTVYLMCFLFHLMCIFNTSTNIYSFRFSSSSSTFNICPSSGHVQTTLVWSRWLYLLTSNWSNQHLIGLLNYIALTQYSISHLNEQKCPITWHHISSSIWARKRVCCSCRQTAWRTSVKG